MSHDDTFTTPPGSLILFTAFSLAIIGLTALRILVKEARRLPWRRLGRWVRGWWLSPHPQHKPERKRARRVFADRNERVPSAEFRTSFAGPLDSPWGTGGPPWSPEPAPDRVADTMVRPLPFGPQPAPRAAAEPVPPGELAPWVLAELSRQHNPDVSLDSIVARVVSRDA